MTTEHLRRTALARSNRRCPGMMPYRKPDEPTKQQMYDDLRQAVINTARMQKHEDDDEPSGARK
jgi:hypothetical protein